MQFFKKHLTGIILCLFEILVGILLLINPAKFTVAIVMIFGAVLIVVGVICVVNYFRTDAVRAAVSQSLVKGLSALAAGIFCLVKADRILSTFPVLAILYGIAVLFAGLFKVQWTADMLRMKMGKWGVPAVSAVLSIVCSIVILNNPFGATVALWIFTGVSLIVEATIDIVALVLLSVLSDRGTTDR